MKPRTTRRQLADATLQLLVQNQLLAELRRDLLRIARRIPASEPLARELRERIGTLACRVVNWENYDGQFRVMHPDFLSRLIERAPELTAIEVRICTMMRMRLKSREMANLMGSSLSEIALHRREIRRKLKLKREEKLPLVVKAI